MSLYCEALAEDRFWSQYGGVPALSTLRSSQQTTPISRKGPHSAIASRGCYKDIALEKLMARMGAEWTQGHRSIEPLTSEVAQARTA